MNAAAAGAELFDPVAVRYDAVNRVLSLGRDTRWRRAVCAHLYPGRPEGALLDVACGTGDQLLALVRGGCRYHTLTGLDVSRKMLEQARQKPLLMRYAIRWVQGSAAAMPFENRAFDAVTLSFGLRNMPDRTAALREIRRVLKPGGRLALLEFSMPEHGLMRRLFDVYRAVVLPLAGGMLTGQFRAYRHLARSIRCFPPPSALRTELMSAGFSQVRVIPVDVPCVFLYLCDATA